MCKILDSWKFENQIKDWEYTKDRIVYEYNGKKSTYLLDFKVFKNDGSYYYLEIKGYQINRDLAKWNETVKQGHELFIWFEKDIKYNESILSLDK